MAGNIRDSNYYRQRAAAIRARGGNEQLAQKMQTYADLYDAGIYNDNSAPVRFGNAPQPAVSAQPAKKSSGGSRKQKVADAPSKYVGSAAIAQRFSQAPESDVDTYRTNYEPSPLGTADFKRMNDTNTPVAAPRQEYIAPSPNNVADFRRYNDTNTIGAAGNYGAPPEDDVPIVQRGRAPRHTGLLGGLENFRLGSVADMVRPQRSAADSVLPQRDAYMNYYAPSTNSIADFKRMNDTNTIGASDLLPQKDAYMDLPTYELPPMEVTAEAPKQESNPQKKFQLVGTKPGGGSALTKYYASQLRYVPYENNKGVNGVKYGSSGLVNRMRELCQIVPYNETDGTNCARTVSAALDGTPYSGMYNVDQMIEMAARQGQLRDAYGGYTPKAGDLAVTNEGNHIVMVTENGGVIQNGQSKNGVYETNKKPWEQKGGVQFYITTSDYNDLFPSFHFGTGLVKDDIFGGR